MCLVANALTTSSRDSSTSSPGLSPINVGRHPPSIEPLNRPEQHLDPLDGLGRQVDRRRLHLHHPPPRDQTGKAATWSRWTWLTNQLGVDMNDQG